MGIGILRVKMFLLLSIMFAIVYAIIVLIFNYIGISNFMLFGVLAVVLIFIQYIAGPKIIEISMHVKYISKEDDPKLYDMVSSLAVNAKIPIPKIGIAHVPIPNAFAFGRWKSDGRVCITNELRELLKENELKAVLGHEISHLKNRDVTTITMLSVIPLVCWYMAWSFMFSGGRKGAGAVIGLFAFALYFITNLLVLYGSRIREYYADEGSISLGSKSEDLATALYKLVYSNAKIPKARLKQMEGYKAFFANDPSRAFSEINELKQIDLDMSGTLDTNELEALRNKKIKISKADHLMEIMSTHPNMVKRIARLADITA